ncbi:MAG: 4Fe-4S binding protein [Chloroflexaceae bacterium]
MHMRIINYTRPHLRVLFADCMRCQYCINICPEEALNLRLGFETHAIELLRTR